MQTDNQLLFHFSNLKRRWVEAKFTGGDITSDTGGLLIRQADRKLGLTRRLAEVLPEVRDESRCQHDQISILRQRIYGMCSGYEDLNDHDLLRQDVGLQTSVDRREALASSPTLCRWENRADRKVGWLIHQVMIEFMGSRRNVFFMDTMEMIVFCLCMCSVGNSFWQVTCVRAISIRRYTPGLFYLF